MLGGSGSGSSKLVSRNSELCIRALSADGWLTKRQSGEQPFERVRQSGRLLPHRVATLRLPR